MADKECTIFIVDVSASMGSIRNGREISDLDWALRYVWERITSTVMSGRKTAHIGVVGLGTDETQNKMEDEAEYQNISVFVPPKQILMPDIEELEEKFQPSHTDDGDAISAVVIGVEIIRDHCKKLKYRKRLVLVTNARGSIDGEDNEPIARQMASEEIEFTVIGVDFDDSHFGIKEENKGTAKKFNENTLQQLATSSGGKCITMAKAALDLDVPTIKPVRPVALYKGLLSLGDYNKFGKESMTIEIERYPRVMMAKAVTAKQFATKIVKDGASVQSSATMQLDDQDVEMGNTVDASNSLSSIKRARAYQVDDADAPGGKRDVDPEELEKGYEYGRTAVSISKDDMNIVQLETEASFQIVGFVEADKFDRYFEMSRSGLVVPARFSEKNTMALASLSRALEERNHYAVARYVAKQNKHPILHLLAPSVELGFDCLIDVELPFAEDIRYYKFPPLDKVVTVAGKNLFQHRTLPSDELMGAMNDFVESMDISEDGQDSDGKPIEYGKPADTYNPTLNRTIEAIKFRAVNPLGSEMPEASEILTRYSKPPKQAADRSKSALKLVIKHSNVKKVDKKEKSRRERRKAQPASALDIDKLLSEGQYKRTSISMENAIPDFKNLLDNADKEEDVKSISEQMGSIIRRVVSESVGDSSYERAIELLGVMRQELDDLEMPEVYNKFMEKLKADLLNERLGTGRNEMWYLMRRNKLGLLSTDGVTDANQ